MRPDIYAGSTVRISRNGRQVVGKVIRVLNLPGKDGAVDNWHFWDLEYKIVDTDRYGRWKQNTDGGTVDLIG